MSEYETMMAGGTHDGAVIQAGMPSRPYASMPESGVADGWIVSAVVEAVYYPDDPSRESKDTDSFYGDVYKNCIVVDVRTITRFSRRLKRVPVAQSMQGLWDLDWYTPRASSQSTNGEAFQSGSAAVDGSPPTPANLADGDHVLVGFRENTAWLPFVFPFTLGHPKGSVPTSGQGRIRTIRHGGTSLTWTETGDITIDATGAAKSTFDAMGLERSNSGASGIVRLVTRDIAAAQSEVILDNVGGIKLTDAGGHYVQLLKSGTIKSVCGSNKIELTSAGTISLESMDRATISTTNMVQITTKDLRATIGTGLVGAGTSFLVQCPAIVLGTLPGYPIVKVSPDWQIAWTDLLTVLDLWIEAWNNVAPPTADTVPPMFRNLVEKLKPIAEGLRPILLGGTAQCLMVRGT